MTMLKKIVLIGYGNIAQKHIEVLRSLGCEIVASCNRSKEMNELARLQSGIPETYTDYHQMIKQTTPDGIVICVSFLQMSKVLKEVIPYKIPILAEKPSGTSYKEHIELQQLSAEHNTSVMLGLNRRHYSVFAKAIDEIGGKDKITTVLVEWSEDPEKLISNKGYGHDELSKLTFGYTIHGIDILTTLAGKISKYHFIKSEHKLPYNWIYNLSGISENGVVFNFNCSWDNPVPWRIVIYAKDTRVEFAPLENAVITRGKNKHIVEADDKDKNFKAGFIRQAQLFIGQNINGYELSSCTDTMWLAEEINNQLQ